MVWNLPSAVLAFVAGPHRGAGRSGSHCGQGTSGLGSVAVGHAPRFLNCGTCPMEQPRPPRDPGHRGAKLRGCPGFPGGMWIPVVSIWAQHRLTPCPQRGLPSRAVAPRTSRRPAQGLLGVPSEKVTRCHPTGHLGPPAH